jgi:hypothetical protein
MIILASRERARSIDALHGAVGFSPFGDVPAASSSMKGILHYGH